MLVVRIDAGSPPQVRGKRQKEIARAVHGRITPAGAGKTVFKHAFMPTLKDHPRRCGENRFLQYIIRCSLGSPPQVRGKRLTVECGEKTDRITPAGAGKTGLL